MPCHGVFVWTLHSLIANVRVSGWNALWALTCFVICFATWHQCFELMWGKSALGLQPTATRFSQCSVRTFLEPAQGASYWCAGEADRPMQDIKLNHVTIHANPLAAWASRFFRLDTIFDTICGCKSWINPVSYIRCGGTVQHFNLVELFSTVSLTRHAVDTQAVSQMS